MGQAGTCNLLKGRLEQKTDEMLSLHLLLDFTLLAGAAHILTRRPMDEFVGISRALWMTPSFLRRFIAYIPFI